MPRRQLSHDPYGMYVLTSKSKDGKDVRAATVNWLIQTSFSPPLVAVGVKGDSGARAHITETSVFAVNVIGKGQLDLAFTFFKGPETGCALLTESPAWWEWKLVGQLDQGDHTLFLGEVLEAGTRAEDQTTLMRDHNLNYGG